MLRGVFTLGTIGVFSAYLHRLYSSLQALTNASVDFATSMVSFERVFEVVGLPLEIEDRPGAVSLTHVQGRVTFEDVTFHYEVTDELLLDEVVRRGRYANVDAALSGRTRGGRRAGQRVTR